jgi:hypothetical protein
MLVYKVKNGEGLYAGSGYHPSFTTLGKIWQKLGHVKSHLRLRGRTLPADWVVQEYELRLVREIPVKDLQEK